MENTNGSSSARFSVQGTVSEMPVEVRQVPGSSKLVFVAHGMGGTMESSLPRSLANSAKLAASVVRFTTSRYIWSSKTGDYAAMQRIFKGKVYAQELEDVRRVVEHVKMNSSPLLHWPMEALQIYLVGTSMGGISAAILGKEFSARGVVIVNSGAWFRAALHLPDLIQGFPPMDSVNLALNSFDSPVLVLRGERDT